MLDMQLQDQTETNIYCVTSFCRFTINQGAPTQLYKYFHRRADVWAEHGLLQLAYQYLFSDATEHLSVQFSIKFVGNTNFLLSSDEYSTNDSAAAAQRNPNTSFTG